MELTKDFAGISRKSVAIAVERIAAACQPRAIMAFGSRARGNARPDSDLDLFVLLNEPVPDGVALRRHLRGLLSDMPFSKDIVVSEPEQFARRKSEVNSIYGEVAREGLDLWREGQEVPEAIDEVCR